MNGNKKTLRQRNIEEFEKGFKAGTKPDFSNLINQLGLQNLEHKLAPAASEQPGDAKASLDQTPPATPTEELPFKRVEDIPATLPTYREILNKYAPAIEHTERLLKEQEKREMERQMRPKDREALDVDYQANRLSDEYEEEAPKPALDDKERFAKIQAIRRLMMNETDPDKRKQLLRKAQDI